MENKFIEGIMKENNKTYTENGALAYRTTDSALLDLFGTIGSLRTRTPNDIIAKFTKAFSEDQLLAMKMLFYARNIRGGLGEKRTFRILINYMAKYHTEIMEKNLDLIPYFGRWDDLYALVDTPLEKQVFDLIREQLKEDLNNCDNGKEISLMAKWLNSTSGVSPQSIKLGRITAKNLHLSYKAYRQILSKLRKKLNIIERNMSQDEWNKIVYNQIPALAMKRYKNALMRHNCIEFDNYIKKVKKGEEKINAKTLYPYDLMKAGRLADRWHSDSCEYYYDLPAYDEVIEQQWKALPNYIEGENNVLVMADTSGSMAGTPVATSIGLSLYFAERNSGPWHNKFLTFSSEPTFIDLKGTNLKEKVNCITDICDNTNIEEAFKLVLATAVNNHLKQEDMPKAIIIISDMEFDSATTARNNETIMEAMGREYAARGYRLPKIIFWNADSRQDVYHAVSETKNVALVSGQSVSTFKTVLNSINEDAYQIMFDTLNDKMYDIVRI